MRLVGSVSFEPRIVIVVENAICDGNAVSASGWAMNRCTFDRQRRLLPPGVAGILFENTTHRCTSCACIIAPSFPFLGVSYLDALPWAAAFAAGALDLRS